MAESDDPKKRDDRTSGPTPSRSGNVTPRPIPLENTESQVEHFHRGNAPGTRRALSMLDEDSTVTIQAPSPVQRGNKKMTPGFVGFRQAATSKGDPHRQNERRKGVKKQMRAQRDARRQVMWDKLDNARRSADERLKRYSNFEPNRDDDPTEAGPDPRTKTRR